MALLKGLTMDISILKSLTSALLLAASINLCADSTADPNVPSDFLEKNYTKISPQEIQGNAVKMVGTDWMIVSAGNEKKFNGMTAGWGGFGVWGKPVAFILIHDTRHTLQFLEQEETFTLSFFDEKYRPALKIFGTKSGRDTDKTKEAGLTAMSTHPGMAYTEAKLVLVCKKIYADTVKGEFKFPPNKEKAEHTHKLYFGEIISVWQKKN